MIKGVKYLMMEDVALNGEGTMKYIYGILFIELYP